MNLVDGNFDDNGASFHQHFHLLGPSNESQNFIDTIHRHFSLFIYTQCDGVHRTRLAHPLTHSNTTTSPRFELPTCHKNITRQLLPHPFQRQLVSGSSSTNWTTVLQTCAILCIILKIKNRIDFLQIYSISVHIQ